MTLASLFPRATYRVAWISQWDQKVPHAGPTACFRACREICKRLGADDASVPVGTTRRFQCASGDGIVHPGETHAATEYLRHMVGIGRGVIVGVNYKQGINQLNRDGLTDHFVVVCAWDEDSMELRGLNPGAVLDADMDYNVAFRWAPTKGAWERTWPSRLTDTVVSMVIPDVERGKSLEERL